MANNITLKLRKAASILEGERYGDWSPGFLVDLVKRNRITKEQIYNAVKYFGFRWRNDHWVRRGPRWFETLKKTEDEKILASWRNHNGKA